MSTDIPADKVGEVLQDYNFTIVELISDPDTKNTVFKIVHDLHPEDEVTIKLISEGEDGEDAMNLQFEGPDEWTEDEATMVLNEVMEMIIYVIEQTVEGEDGEPDEPVETAVINEG